MDTLLNRPLFIFLIAFFLLWIAAWLGHLAGERSTRDRSDEAKTGFGVVLAATLTLLGLIIGFTFSMASGRYDVRKTYEEAEANAIGTEYVRADLLPAADAAQVQMLLRRYTDLRIRFYTTRSQDDLQEINAETAKVQGQLWAGVSRPAKAQPSPLIALAVGGMNDVLNSQGYTQAAWWNRIPAAAWLLMFAIALFSNCMLGYGELKTQRKLLAVLPLVVAISFFLIADIDSPRSGLIRVHPQNLISLQESLK